MYQAPLCRKAFPLAQTEAADITQPPPNKRCDTENSSWRVKVPTLWCWHHFQLSWHHRWVQLIIHFSEHFPFSEIALFWFTPPHPHRMESYSWLGSPLLLSLSPLFNSDCFVRMVHCMGIPGHVEVWHPRFLPLWYSSWCRHLFHRNPCRILWPARKEKSQQIYPSRCQLPT